MKSHFINYTGWIFALIWFSVATILSANCYKQRKEIEYQKVCMFNIRQKNLQLEKSQRKIDWLEGHLQEIDDYIRWKDVMKIKGAESVPKIVRTPEELNRERLEVIKSAIAMAEKDL